MKITIDYFQLGKNLRNERLRRHLTLEELAKKTHIGCKHISNIENAHTHPSLETLVVIADALHVSMDELVSSTHSSY